ncbi:sugar ABC transporter substrate-binding protein [Colwellia sp. 12G3]|uniref:sugar ABC transporter substrate-binding protein n=1 Tax=Colwellia sp. 12G3 TaxID=2058299 RepID=UPI000C324903|nr:extracellular solute-binding protein [Colwellia sp. 12G3]PKI12884.1 hypothetical protein CXF71_19405 [Colwellia sp. 12G3]
MYLQRFKTILPLMFMLFYSSSLLAKTQLVLWHSWVENNSLWLKIKQDFNAEHKDIELKINGFAHEEMKKSIILSGFKSKSADIILMPSDWLGYHNVMQFSVISKDIINPAVNPVVIDQTTFKNEILGIPLFQGNHLLFMYNKSLVDDPATTWEALVNASEDLNKKGIKPVAINYNEMFWFVPFIDAFGGFPVDKEKVKLNTAATVSALKYYKYLAKIGVLDKDCTYQCVSTDFYQGKFAYSLSGSWTYKLAKKALGDNLGLAPFPTLNGHEFKPMKGNLVIAFPKHSLQGSKHDALVKFSHFIQQEKYQQLMFEESSVFPVNVAVMTKILAHADSDFKFSYAQFQRSRALPASTSIPAVWNGMYKGFMLYMQGELSAKEAAIYMQKSVEREQMILNRKHH